MRAPVNNLRCLDTDNAVGSWKKQDLGKWAKEQKAQIPDARQKGYGKTRFGPKKNKPSSKNHGAGMFPFALTPLSVEAELGFKGEVNVYVLPLPICRERILICPLLTIYVIVLSREPDCEYLRVEALSLI